MVGLVAKQIAELALELIRFVRGTLQGLILNYIPRSKFPVLLLMEKFSGSGIGPIL
jgi:hypothetical protein